jgi:elongation factor 3
VVDFICKDPLLQALPRDLVTSTLQEVGFTPEMQALVLTKISGGWKMKLALARAMLLKADILLLDGEQGEGGECTTELCLLAHLLNPWAPIAPSCAEPTNHLDTANVAWLEGYLSNSNITCMIVSHDSGFLDNVCTDIYHYETRRLKLYRGNLSAFVKVCENV